MTKLFINKNYIYMVNLIMVKLTILNLIMAQLPMKKLIKIKIKHN
jgi:hypothetical protein